MGGTHETLKAKTKKELKKKVKEWLKKAKQCHFYEYWGWDPKQVRKTKDGYEILVRAHT